MKYCLFDTGYEFELCVRHKKLPIFKKMKKLIPRVRSEKNITPDFRKNRLYLKIWFINKQNKYIYIVGEQCTTAWNDLFIHMQR